MNAANVDNLSVDGRFADAGDASRKGLNEIRNAHAAENDAELVRSFMGGSKESFAALVDRHMPMVYKFAYRYTLNADATNDIVQDVFLKVWKNIKKFDPEKSFTTWLLTVTKNTALDAIKKKKALSFSAIEAFGEMDLEAFLAPYVETKPLPDALAEGQYAKAEMERALAELAPAYRSVIALRYGEDMKFREIAEVLREPIDTVKSKHRRALMALRRIIRHPN